MYDASTPTATCVIVNKGERGVAATLDALDAQIDDLGRPIEVVVVDASGGALDDIYSGHERVRVVPFAAPPGVAVTIPHQRNHGIAHASTDTIVFTDAGCLPRPGWLAALLAPLADGEVMVTGATVAPHGINQYEGITRAHHDGYVDECPTINLAFRRSVADAVGGFDETFAYGSDVDFSWRVIGAGHRIRFVPDAVLETDWGTWRRQLRRSFVYGRARARLYRKHRDRLADILRRDPIVVAYPLFLLGLPLALRWPWYVLLLAVPAWRNRGLSGLGGVTAVLDHLVYGLGVLRELGSWPGELTGTGRGTSPSR